MGSVTRNLVETIRFMRMVLGETAVLQIMFNQLMGCEINIICYYKGVRYTNTQILELEPEKFFMVNEQLDQFTYERIYQMIQQLNFRLTTIKKETSIVEIKKP